MKRTSNAPFSFHIDLDKQQVDSLAAAWLKSNLPATNRVRAAGRSGAPAWWCLLLVGLMGFFPASLRAQTVTSPPKITIDGDPSDWPAVLGSTGYVTAFKRDANNSNDDQFTGGSSDRDLISKWSWVNGQTNDKGDISNAGAAIIGDNLYFFGDRTAINGDASIGFWFFSGGVAPVGATGGGFSGKHMVGDILVLSNFTNGGGTVNLGIYRWVGSGGNAGNGALNFLATKNSADVNTKVYTVPTFGTAPNIWGYTPKSGTGYVVGSFFEGTINLRDPDLMVDPCFTNFLLETRNSQSVTASLQDLAAGVFESKPVAKVNSATRCANDPNATLTATVEGGLAPLTYNWTGPNGYTSTSTTSPSISVTAAGDYTVTVIGANGCSADPAKGTVTVNPTPAGTDASMSSCPTTIGGTTAVFDLTSKNSTVIGSSGATVAWYEGYDATTKAFSTAITNANAAAYSSASKTVYAKLTSSSGCIGVAQNVLTVNPTPAGTDASMSSCPTTIGGTTAVFDLTSKNSTVTGGASGVSVAWYEGYNASTGAFSNPIGTAAASYTSGSKTVYAQLTSSSSTGSCIGVAQNVLTVNPTPAGTDASMSSCPTTIGGTTAVFDLTSKNSTVIGSSGATVAWYEGYDATTKAFSTAITNANAAAYSSASKTVYAKLTSSSGCIGVAQNVLTVNPTPAGTDASMSSCPTTIGGTTAVFDLTSKNSTVIGSSGATVAGWYETYANGTFSNLIANAAAYSSASKTVYAKLTSSSGCIGVAQNVLTLNPTPAGTNTSMSTCPTTAGGSTGVFDLTSKNNTVIGSSGATVAGWYETYANGTFSNLIATPGAYTSGSKTVYAKLSGSCIGVANNVLSLTASPLRPNVTITEPKLCGPATATVTVPSSILNATYKLVNSGVTTTKTGTGKDLDFGGLAAGSGFSITVTIGGCESAPTDCSNYTTPAARATLIDAQPLAAPLQGRIQTAAYPNPTSKDATIVFSVPTSGHTVVGVYDALGRQVATLFDGPATAGEQRTVVLKGEHLASGDYFYRVSANGATTTSRISLTK